jgi:hypothetical protein
VCEHMRGEGMLDDGEGHRGKIWAAFSHNPAGPIAKLQSKGGRILLPERQNSGSVCAALKGRS